MRKFKVTVEGQIYEVAVEEISAQTTTAAQPSIVNNQPAPEATQKTTVMNSPVSSPPAREKESTDRAGGSVVPAPMPGSIIEVRVKTGDAVSPGDVLLILEAMKMENEITSPVKGTVTKITIKGGDTVNSGDPLVYIE